MLSRMLVISLGVGDCVVELGLSLSFWAFLASLLTAHWYSGTTPGSIKMKVNYKADISEVERGSECFIDNASLSIFKHSRFTLDREGDNPYPLPPPELTCKLTLWPHSDGEALLESTLLTLPSHVHIDLTVIPILALVDSVLRDAPSKETWKKKFRKLQM